MEKCAGRKGCIRPVGQVYLGRPLCDHHFRLLCNRLDAAEGPDLAEEREPAPRAARRQDRHAAVSYVVKVVDGERILVPFQSRKSATSLGSEPSVK